MLTQSCTFLTFIFTYLKDDRGLDAGRGWSQKALLRVGDAHVEGAFSEESRIAYDGVYCLSHGALRVGADHLSGNLIPIPLDVDGDVELMLECWAMSFVCLATQQNFNCSAIQNMSRNSRETATISDKPVNAADSSFEKQKASFHLIQDRPARVDSSRTEVFRSLRLPA